MPLRRPSPIPIQLQRQQGYDDDDTIRAWASSIPPGAPAPTSPTSTLERRPSRPDFPLSRQLPAKPALCMNNSQPARTARTTPSTPISFHRSPVDSEHQEEAYSAESLASVLSGSVQSRYVYSTAEADPARIAPGPFRGALDNIASRLRGMTNGPRPVPQLTVLITSSTSTTVDSPKTETEDDFSNTPSTLTTPKSGYCGFTVLSTAHTPGSDVFSTYSSEKKAGMWIAGREQRDESLERFGPGYYENAALKQQRAPVHLKVTSVHTRQTRRIRAVDSDSEDDEDDFTENLVAGIAHRSRGRRSTRA